MNPGNKSGYSLVEVLISLVLLSFASSAYMIFSTGSGASSTHSLKVSVASNVVENVANDLSMVGSSNLWLMSQSELPVGTPYPFKRFFAFDGRETTVADQIYYTVSWVVQADIPITGARSIGMTIQWKEGSIDKTLAMRVVR